MIKAIVASSRNGVIGKDNALPWGHIPEDMKRFKVLTTGHVVVMGRKTFESLPNGALPNRLNIVLTRDKNYNAENVMIVHSVEEALTYYQSIEEMQDLWVIGGKEIYEAFAEHCEEVYLTLIHMGCEGDVRYPDFGEGWIQQSEDLGYQCKKVGVNYSFHTLVR